MAYNLPTMSQPLPEQPPGSSIVLTPHEAGVTLDFPLFEEAHLEARRRAWRSFELGIFLLIGCVILFAAFRMLEPTRKYPLLPLLFLAGIALLIRASSRSWFAWNNTRGDDFLAQLAVIDDLLIRTWRNHRKEVWYRREILAVRVIDKFDAIATPRGDTPSFLFTSAAQLVLELQNGNEIILLADGTNLPVEEFRSRAEMDWIAAVLGHALPSAPREPDSSQAIQTFGERARETRMRANQG